MKFLVDNQLPSALSRYLSSRGFDCVHVEDFGLSQASDIEIWRYAGENELVIVSKDEDFVYLANASKSKAKLVWVRLGNCRTVALLAVIDRAWPRIEAALRAGDRVVELR